MSSELEFSDICLLVRGCLVSLCYTFLKLALNCFTSVIWPYILHQPLQNGGKLKLHKNGVVFKNNKTGKVEQLNSSEFASVKWMKVAFGYEVKFILNTGTQFKFEGFKESVRCLRCAGGWRACICSIFADSPAWSIFYNGDQMRIQDVTRNLIGSGEMPSQSYLIVLWIFPHWCYQK